MTTSIDDIKAEITDHRERLGQALIDVRSQIGTVRTPSGAFEAMAPMGEDHPLVDLASAALRRHSGPLLLIGVSVLQTS